MIVSLLVCAASFYIVSHLVEGWKVKDFPTAILVALVYGLLSVLAFMPKLLAFLCALPLFILFPKFVVGTAIHFAFTLGLLYLTDKLIDGFSIKDLPSAVVGAIVLNVVSAFLRFFLPF